MIKQISCVSACCGNNCTALPTKYLFLVNIILSVAKNIFFKYSSSSKPVWISLFCRTQRKIFWRKFVTGYFGAPLTSIVGKKYHGSQWCPKTTLLNTKEDILKNVGNRAKKFIQVWNYLRVSKWWQNFYFWVNYPFNNEQIFGWIDLLNSRFLQSLISPLQKEFGSSLSRRVCSSIFVFVGIMCVRVLLNQTWQMVM